MSNKTRTKRVLTLEKLLQEQAKNTMFYNNKFTKALNDAKADEKLKIGNQRTSNYSLRTKILKNPWIKSSPYTKALRWLHQEVFKDPKTYRYKRLLFRQGGFYTFEYKNPKYKGTSRLPWFDIHPLVISLGPVVTNEGIRNIGFNLHLLPPKIRILVICGVFELYKRHYRYNIYNYNRQKRLSKGMGTSSGASAPPSMKPVNIKYQYIIKKLWRFGIGFCVRMYIPKRITQIVEFPYKDWHKAIFIPSKKYDGILAAQLIKEWRLYTRKIGSPMSPNINWQNLI